MIGSRSPILVATFSTTSGGAMPPTIRRTGSPGTTRSNVKMISEVMKTIRRPCAIRLTRNSRIDFERLEIDLESLLLKHARDQFGIFLGLRIEADRGVIGQLWQTLPLGEAGFREQLLCLVRIEFRIVGDFRIAELDRRNMRL